MARSTHVIVALVAAAAAVAFTTGVSIATPASAPSVKACGTSAGYLRLAKANDACPSGTSAVTINEQGPRGPRGLSPVSLVIDRTTPGGSGSASLPNGDALSIFCGSNNGIPTPFVEVSRTSAAYFVHGTLDNQGTGVVDYIDASGTVAWPPGHSLVGQSPTGYFQFADLASSSGPAYASIHVLVNDQTDVFTLDISIYSATDRCQITVEAIPA